MAEERWYTDADGNKRRARGPSAEELDEAYREGVAYDQAEEAERRRMQEEWIGPEQADWDEDELEPCQPIGCDAGIHLRGCKIKDAQDAHDEVCIDKYCNGDCESVSPNAGSAS